MTASKPFLLLAGLALIVTTGCMTTQTTSEKKEAPKRETYETVTPTGSNRILRQKKDPQVKDPHDEAVRNKLLDDWGREADRILVKKINEGKPQ